MRGKACYNGLVRIRRQICLLLTRRSLDAANYFPILWPKSPRNLALKSLLCLASRSGYDGRLMYRSNCTVVWLTIFLCSCAQQQQSQIPDWQARYDAAASECTRTHSGPYQDLPRARCMAIAEDILRTAPGVYQDLITLRQTSRIALATKVQNKQMSREDAAAQMAQVMSYVASEAQRRDTGQQVANSQQAAAVAALLSANRPTPPVAQPVLAAPPVNRPIVCNSTGLGNTVSTTCN
jgi:hypothetical protein